MAPRRGLRDYSPAVVLLRGIPGSARFCTALRSRNIPRCSGLQSLHIEGIPVAVLPARRQSAESESLPMTATPAIAGTYTFDPFARHQFYHDVNQSLVRTAIKRLDADRPAGEQVRVVELASGTGAVTELILDELERRGRPATVIGVEPSFEAIDV